MKVCVFASSSDRINAEFSKAAAELGRLLAVSGMQVVYGGGGIGLMGRLADSVLEAGGTITGVIPSFMKDEGWDHPGVSEMFVTADMGERKKKMFYLADAVVALPGGIGTLEELTEAITLKQLGIYSGPVVILNTLDYYNSLIDFLDHMVAGHFMKSEHKVIWEVVDTPEQVIDYLSKYEGWIENPRRIARII